MEEKENMDAIAAQRAEKMARDRAKRAERALQRDAVTERNRQEWLIPLKPGYAVQWEENRTKSTAITVPRRKLVGTVPGELVPLVEMCRKVASDTGFTTAEVKQVLEAVVVEIRDIAACGRAVVLPELCVIGATFGGRQPAVNRTVMVDVKRGMTYMANALGKDSMEPMLRPLPAFTAHVQRWTKGMARHPRRDAWEAWWLETGRVTPEQVAAGHVDPTFVPQAVDREQALREQHQALREKREKRLAQEKEDQGWME